MHEYYSNILFITDFFFFLVILYIKLVDEVLVLVHLPVFWHFTLIFIMYMYIVHFQRVDLSLYCTMTTLDIPEDKRY